MAYPRIAGLVSIVVTNYNNEHYIQECLDSLYRQSYGNWEIIVVDDASSDDSKRRLLQWIDMRRPEQSVHLASLPRNAGFAGALTTGYFLSRGEFIAVQDADDLAHPERLEKQVQYLRSHPSVDIVGTNYAAFEKEVPERPTGQSWIKYGDAIRAKYAAGGHCVCHGSIMFRGELFDRIGGPTRRIEGAEDYEFIAKSLTNGAKVENLRDILYFYRLHPTQRSLQFYGNRRGDGE